MDLALGDQANEGVELPGAQKSTASPDVAPRKNRPIRKEKAKAPSRVQPKRSSRS